MLVVCLVLVQGGAFAWHTDDAPVAPYVPIASGDWSEPVLVNDGEGALVAARDGRLWRVEAGGVTSLAPLAAFDVRSIERDGSGRLYLGEWMRTYVHEAGARTPFTDGIHGRFGPDGRMYFIRAEEGGASALWALDEARMAERILDLPDYAFAMAFTPEGGLRVVASGDVYAVDLGARTIEPWGDFRINVIRDLAVDSIGRLYGSTVDGAILRIDGPGVLSTVFGLAPDDGEDRVRIVFGGSRLYAATSTGVGAFTLEDGVLGFGGFHPSFDPALPADLVVELAEDHAVDAAEAQRVTRVTLRNAGGSWVEGGWRVSLARLVYARPLAACVNLDPFGPPGGCERQGLASATYAGDLAPGATAILEITWDGTLAAGTQRLEVELDAGRVRVEADEGNNLFTFRANARAGTPVGGV